MGDTESSYQTMVCGVLQGNSLGPFLFLIYSTDLPNCSEFLSFKIFADDTNLFASAKDIKSLELQMNLELKKGQGMVWHKQAIDKFKENQLHDCKIPKEKEHEC